MSARGVRTRSVAAVAAAAALPALLGALCLDRGHHGDVGTFYKWWAAARSGFSNLYVQPHADVNYPVLGAAAATAGGALHRLFTGSDPGPAQFHRWHHALLVPWNALLVLLFARLAAALGARKPLALAVALWALPCTWVASLYFAQIDAVPVVFALASTLCAHRFALGGAREARWLAGALGLAACAALTKQLSAFALPALLLHPAAARALAPRSAGGDRGPGRARWLLAGAAFPAALFAFDPLLALPRPYRAHLAYVWLGVGPRHQDMLGNGPSVWAFLRREPTATSHAPLFGPATPYGLGLALFAGLVLVTLVAVGRALRARPAPRELLALSLSANGLLNLAMAIALAGSHDRYAFFAFPPLLLSAGARATGGGQNVRAARGLFATTALAGCAYGLYLLGTVEFDALEPLAVALAPHRVAAVLLALFAVTAGELLLSFRP